MINQMNKSKLGTISMALSTIILFLIFNTPIEAAGLLLVEGQPRSENRYHQQIYPTIIYRLDEDNHNIDTMWKANNIDDIVWDIYLYHNEKILLVSYGRDNFANYFNIFLNFDIANPFTIEKNRNIFAYDYHLLSDDNKKPLLSMDVAVDKNKPSLQNIIVDIITGNKQPQTDLATIGYSVKLSGPLPPYASGVSDVIGVNISMGNIIVNNMDYNISLPRLPDNLIQIDSSFGWVMHENSDSFCVIASIPYQGGQKERELLIYSRSLKSWRSIMIKGSETAPRSLGKWLVGEVAYSDPQTNWERRTSFGPPIYSGEAVIINPEDGNQNTVFLGDSCEVLWIDNYENIYYHLVDSLFMGQIEGSNIVNRKLILQDPRIRRIHWGFETE